MTQEDKQLLLKDLCSRLPYGVKCCIKNNCKISGHLVGIVGENISIFSSRCGTFNINIVKPYLRLMSSMTKEEEEEYHNLCYEEEREEFEFGEWTTMAHYHDTINSIDYLNSIHIDYRGLITKGLAIEVTKENNPYQF